MFHTLKKYLFLFLFSFNINNIYTENNPYIFIDSNAQDMVEVLTLDSNLFESDRETYENKIKEIFEPMIDFRRVSASVMGKKYYLLATKEQRVEFIEIFRDSLLDTYAETLAQWGESTISTEFPEGNFLSKKFESFENNVEVKQILNTGTSEYPISYKLKKSGDGWKIVNIIINGVNLGLTFRNQFQALAISHSEDIELTLKNWVSDAGDAGIS
tara:strand:+ start:759 stop:1400 length:642 start_codon:yes stop_codon:yes gene_type:complete